MTCCIQSCVCVYHMFTTREGGGYRRYPSATPYHDSCGNVIASKDSQSTVHVVSHVSNICYQPIHSDMVWCGVVWCGVVWCGVVWCGVVWCGVVWCGVVWCGVVWCAEGTVTKWQWPGCLAYG